MEKCGVAEPVAAWRHTNCLSGNAAMVLQCLVVVLHSRFMTGLCTFGCRGDGELGHEVRFLHM